jgi:ABC-2 type transport system ATP-binding protein
MLRSGGICHAGGVNLWRSFVAVIEVESLVKAYDGTRVVDEVTFGVERGEIFGIVGPNGAGKTTIVESIGGLRQPDSGSITVLGMDPTLDQAELSQRLGAQLQESRLQERIRVWEALDLYASFYRRPAHWPDLLERVGLGAKRNAKYGDLSGGQKQRLSVALALVGSPEIALLDELTTGLDPQARRSTWDMIEQIRAEGVTVVLVTHFMEEAERLCDRVMVVDGGRVVAMGSPSALVEQIGAKQYIRFRPSQPIDDHLLEELPGVETLRRDGRHIVVTGTGNVLFDVVSLLARLDVIAEQLRVDQSSLEDVYLELTGESVESQPSEID